MRPFAASTTAACSLHYKMQLHHERLHWTVAAVETHGVMTRHGLSVHVSVVTVLNIANTAESIKMPFAVQTHGIPRIHGVRIPHDKRHFCGGHTGTCRSLSAVNIINIICKRAAVQ